MPMPCLRSRPRCNHLLTTSSQVVPKEEIMKQKPDRVLIFCLAGFVALQLLVALRDITGFGALGHEMNVVGAAISLLCVLRYFLFNTLYRNG